MSGVREDRPGLAGLLEHVREGDVVVVVALDRAAARARGRHTGRPPRLSADQVRQVRSLRAAGESISDLVRGFGVSRATIYRALGHAEDQPVEALA